MSDWTTYGIYRLFWIDASGRVEAAARPFPARDDQDALRQASALADGDRVELWRGMHLVARIEASAEPVARH